MAKILIYAHDFTFADLYKNIIQQSGKHTAVVVTDWNSARTALNADGHGFDAAILRVGTLGDNRNMQFITDFGSIIKIGLITDDGRSQREFADKTQAAGRRGCEVVPGVQATLSPTNIDDYYRFFELVMRSLPEPTPPNSPAAPKGVPVSSPKP